MAALKAGPGKDIWLFGGGSLFSSLAKDGLVDTVEVAIVPILLGAGVPLLPRLENRIQLSLRAHRVHRSGRVSLEYAVSSTFRNESSPVWPRLGVRGSAGAANERRVNKRALVSSRWSRRQLIVGCKVGGDSRDARLFDSMSFRR